MIFLLGALTNRLIFSRYLIIIFILVNKNYKGLNFANQVITKVGEMTSEQISDAQKKQIIGEATFLRGYYHFKLLTLYGQIIIRDELISQETLDKPLSTRSEAWNIIIDDFTTAFKYVDFPFKVKSSAMKILKAKNEKVSSLKNNLNGKIVIDNGELLIYNEHGAVNCTIIQLENKREMTAKELLNGLKFHENSRVY